MIRQSVLDRFNVASITEPTEYILEYFSVSDFFYSLSDYVDDLFPETIKVKDFQMPHGLINISGLGVAFFLRLVISEFITKSQIEATITANDKVLTIIINYGKNTLDRDQLSRVAAASGLLKRKPLTDRLNFTYP